MCIRDRSMTSTWTLMFACAPANYGCTFFFLVMKRCCRSSKETAPSEGPIPRLFRSHPYQSPRLRRSASSAVPPPVRTARLRRPGSVWTTASNAPRLGCWALQLTASRCHASCEGFNNTTGVEHMAPLPTRKIYHPVPELERYVTDPARHVSLGVAQEAVSYTHLTLPTIYSV